MDTNDFNKELHHYYTKIRETNHPYYWYCLANTQARAGLTTEALQSIEFALSFPNPFPSKHKLLEIRAGLQSADSRQVQTNGPSIVTIKRGDIDGDGIKDNVFLTAYKTPDSPFWKDITLVVQNGRTHHYDSIHFKNNSGYNPTLFQGDFTGKKGDDILVVIETGGSAGTIYAYIFSYINGQLRQIFNSEVFNDSYKYDVTYENQYKAKVISYHLKEKYILDLTYKGKEYLSEIYSPQGILKAPINGWVNPLSGLYPIDFNRDDIYELEAYQRIAGRYNADNLGYVQTLLKWNGQVFGPDRQTVAMSGGEM
ncbi:VCBS repeat-containing protein [Bacillus sp. ISL-40]|uniref:VCBS repeat-containing protein n=1 Tax=unclassified Bacillus (in: firmicutes) TaxID=185979 RepID=UPI001BE7AF44|nr:MULTISPECIES: VCBS repeat-containing protein [unclassified Bacillus (in: firmicutes)]MBT2698577.1 VCBS repeat-containing protein [Bacillus sp. ISL-40]MBT2720210.1 VCBS repeat-containing protein [Bacillus sp. ISL-46]MBT2739197.1 VCBS repeat-containing protein [Bacillus sp. ISL-77]